LSSAIFSPSKLVLSKLVHELVLHRPPSAVEACQQQAQEQAEQARAGKTDKEGHKRSWQEASAVRQADKQQAREVRTAGREQLHRVDPSKKERRG
jgi:hypothetical protein